MRPDHAYAIGALGWFCARPEAHHWSVAVHVCQYIRGSLKLRHRTRPRKLPPCQFRGLQRFCWGVDPATSRSTMGYAFLLAGGAISWSSRIQSRVANPQQRPSTLVSLMQERRQSSSASYLPNSVSPQTVQHASLATIRAPMLSLATPSFTIGQSTFNCPSTLSARWLPSAPLKSPTSP